MVSSATNDASRRDFLQHLTALSGAGLGGSLLFSACANEPSEEEVATQDGSQRRDVERLNEIRKEWAEAETSGDVSIIDKYGADDLVHMPPGRPPVTGAEAVKTGMQKWFKAYDVEVELNSEEIVVSGDLAFDRGTGYQRQVPKDGGEPIEGNYSYLWVYQRTPEGWKQTRAIWNENG